MEEDISKNLINDRFVMALNIILSTRNISKSELAKSLDISPSKFTEILKKRMLAGSDLISKLCVEFPVSYDFILTGMGPMFFMENAGDFSITRAEILSRLQEILRREGMSIGEYESSHHIIKGTFENAKKRATPKITYDWATAILAEYPNYSYDWVFKGEGDIITQHIGDNNSGVIINGSNNDSPIDNRHYYSDSPDVLRNEIMCLEEEISMLQGHIKTIDTLLVEKDAQIKEKDAQIKQLLDILQKK